MKLLSIYDLQTIRKRAAHALLLREESNKKLVEESCGLAAGTEHLQILTCEGTGCKASSSHTIRENLKKAIEKNGIAIKWK
ncbi:YzbB [Bacteroides pyogenes DSM 20611 = JCM 6294]|uniref:YzbB n=1 Tax=Bacteroides pyogenes DSM 20611 = JCM 6294 TaxID=1121100 RepID=W4PD75_9BACE|nr:YzbB [Bacteroides pyogenes DSM 20611 = JCM 6294]